MKRLVAIAAIAEFRAKGLAAFLADGAMGVQSIL
jgi:hypothetical protein